MLFKTLDNLRTKPKIVRDHYAFLIAVCFTLFVMGLWALSLPSRFDRITRGDAATTTAPFAGLFSQFKDQFGSSVEVATSSPETDTSSLEAALNLELSSTTRATAQDSGVTVRFSSTTATTTSLRPTILIGTSSSATTSTE